MCGLCKGLKNLTNIRFQKWIQKPLLMLVGDKDSKLIQISL